MLRKSRRNGDNFISSSFLNTPLDKHGRSADTVARSTHEVHEDSALSDISSNESEGSDSATVNATPRLDTIKSSFSLSKVDSKTESHSDTLQQLQSDTTHTLA